MKRTGDSFVNGIIRAEKERLLEYEKFLNVRITDAQKEAQKLTERFREIDPGIKKVILFGSLAESTVRSENFDIDLAVESDRYLQMVSVALDSKFKVDLVELGAVPESIRRRILEKGRILHEA
jgi:predicted nucleotidyltransferase